MFIPTTCTYYHIFLIFTQSYKCLTSDFNIFTIRICYQVNDIFYGSYTENQIMVNIVIDIIFIVGENKILTHFNKLLVVYT